MLCLLPQTFMNLSGVSVAPATRKIDSLPDLLIVYDDIDLEFGNIRFKRNGSSGGHKGLKSIIEVLGTEDIPRLRVGIRPARKFGDTADFVLKPFLKAEREILSQAIETAVEGISAWISEGMDVCMRRYNRKNLP